MLLLIIDISRFRLIVAIFNENFLVIYLIQRFFIDNITDNITEMKEIEEK